MDSPLITAPKNTYQPPTYTKVIIYHGGCPDGLTAAWMFMQSAEFTNAENTTYYHPAFERDFRKDTRMPDLADKDVYIVDYSYPRNVLASIGRVAKSVHIFDHHKTAQSDLAESIYNVHCVFDMNRCGAEIAFDEMLAQQSAKQERPWWLKHIRDRDLWKWDHPDSTAFAAAFFDMGICFESITTIDNMTESERASFIMRGRTLIEFQEREVANICKFARLVEFEGHPVYAVNSITYRSEVGNVLANKPECSFAFVYRYDIDHLEWFISLRGDSENKIDLSKIAQKYGGGGHPNACGFAYKGPINNILKPVPQKTGFSNE